MEEINGWKKSYRPKYFLMINKILPLKITLLSILILFITNFSYAQLKWKNVDSLYQPLPSSIHVYYTNDKIDTASFRAYYVIADIKDRHLNFTADTSYKRRLTPIQFYKKNEDPVVVVNCAFFSFDKNRNLSLIIKNGKLIAYNSASLKNSGKDSAVPKIPFRSAIGITKNRHADIAWTYTDSTLQYARASQTVIRPRDAPVLCCELSQVEIDKKKSGEKKWYVNTF